MGRSDNGGIGRKIWRKDRNHKAKTPRHGKIGEQQKTAHAANVEAAPAFQLSLQLCALWVVSVGRSERSIKLYAQSVGNGLLLHLCVCQAIVL